MSEAQTRHHSRELEDALTALDGTVLPLSLRGVQEASVRRQYAAAIKAAVAEIRGEVASGALTPEQGAVRAGQVRNIILAQSRARSSELGRAWAEAIKQEGKTFPELVEKYAQRLFQKAPAALSEAERDGVMREIIGAAARDNAQVSGALRFLGPASRGLVALSIGLAIYEVYESPDRPREALHQGVLIGSGAVGSYVVGALGVSLVCGPGAPVCAGVFLVVGGIGFALGADYFWRRLQPGEPKR